MPARNKVFKKLKHAFTTASMLTHYDLSLQTWMEIDASNFVTAKVLSQMHSDILKLVTNFSRKIMLAE